MKTQMMRIESSNNMMKKLTLSMIVAVYTPLANATIYQYQDGPGNFGNGGTFDTIFAEYNTVTSYLTWEVDNARKDGQLMDGFWLVLNDGPNNPKGSDGLPIFYADYNSDRLWVFGYNGQNNPNSYQSQDFLGEFSSSLTESGTNRGFSLDVSDIFSSLLASVPFDDQIGIWFHPTWNTQTYTDNGQDQLVDWQYSTQSWYDRSGRPTTQVPEPSSLVLLAVGLLGINAFRRFEVQSSAA